MKPTERQIEIIKTVCDIVHHSVMDNKSGMYTIDDDLKKIENMITDSEYKDLVDGLNKILKTIRFVEFPKGS